ncbi:MAG: hypothetical protein QM706_01370 [Nitrospira sp.]
MANFLIAFLITSLASMAIGPLTTAITSWCNKHFPPLTYSCSSDPSEPYPKMLLLKIAVWCMFLASVNLVALIFVTILASFGLIPDARSLLFAFIAIFLGASALHFSIAFMIRCPKCMRHLLIRWSAHPQHDEKTQLGTDVLTAIALKAVMDKAFQCLECGQWFSSKPTGSRSPSSA